MSSIIHGKGSNRLDEFFEIGRDVSAAFERQGFVHLRGVLSPSVLQRLREPFGEVFRRCAARELTGDVREDDMHTIVDYPMLRSIANGWEKSPAVAAVVLSKRLGKIAADLLGVRRVRVWHDDLLMKPAGGGPTQCHCDGNRNPVSTTRMCMAWIPLQATDATNGALGFFGGSHRHVEARARQYPVEKGPAAWAAFDARLRADLEDAGHAFQLPELALGDLSVHALWTFHAAAPNTSEEHRRVLRISFVDADMVLTEPQNEHQRRYLNRYAPDVPPGGVLQSPYTPVVYDQARDC